MKNLSIRLFLAALLFGTNVLAKTASQEHCSPRDYKDVITRQVAILNQKIEENLAVQLGLNASWHEKPTLELQPGSFLAEPEDFDLDDGNGATITYRYSFRTMDEKSWTMHREIPSMHGGIFGGVYFNDSRDTYFHAEGQLKEGMCNFLVSARGGIVDTIQDEEHIDAYRIANQSLEGKLEAQVNVSIRK